jgi:hypothetical protein
MDARTVTELPQGTLADTYPCGRFITGRFSDDNGRTWSDPVAMEPTLQQLPNGTSIEVVRTSGTNQAISVSLGHRRSLRLGGRQWTFGRTRWSEPHIIYGADPHQ